MNTIPNITIPARPWLSIPEDFRLRRVRIGRQFANITLPEQVRSPLVVNLGMGTDSTALLVLLVEAYEAGNKDARPDLIIFANTGSEKQNTYDFIPVINDYLAKHRFPQVTIVAKVDRGLKHASLHEQCLTLKTMPSLAYGGKSCSLKWKVDEMEHFINRWDPALCAIAAGLPVIKAIGYDASPADMKRSKNPGDEKEQFWYPLRDAGITRPDLIEIIKRSGMPQPGKSACFMCPASKRQEVVFLLGSEPEKLALALKIEAGALLKTVKEGKLSSTIGLGRNWNWREYLETAAPDHLRGLDAGLDCGLADWREYKQLRAALETEIDVCDVTSSADGETESELAGEV